MISSYPLSVATPIDAQETRIAAIPSHARDAVPSFAPPLLIKLWARTQVHQWPDVLPSLSHHGG